MAHPPLHQPQSGLAQHSRKGTCLAPPNSMSPLCIPRLITSCGISVPRDIVWQILAQGKSTKLRAGNQGFTTGFSGHQLELGLCCSHRAVLGLAA